ncbi:MAG: 4-hydroxy-tetrahydrodipicolinate synthase [Gammaproteobacteria bacterium]|jgi:4-hydroxy-tetrahydrodipicolinate synthase
MFQGSMVALVTPMTEQGALDFEALERLIEFHISEGTDAIVAAGTTGESPTLETTEHVEFLETVIQMVGGRIPVIAGTGSNSTAQTLSLSRRAADLGADALLLVVPYYNKPSQEGLYQHFRTIAESVSVPSILYNVPGRTSCDLKPETVARLSKVSNVVGIKEATGDIERLKQLQELCEDRIELYSGDDATAMEFILQGGLGDISVTANVAPKLMHDMCEAARKGDRKTAESINKRLEKLHKLLFVESNPVPVKWALKEMGLIDGGIRLPLVSLNEEFHDQLRDALREAGLLAAN